MSQVSGVLRKTEAGYSHWCPACKEMHAIAVEKPLANGAQWSFDGYVEMPSFRPSINIHIPADDGDPEYRCHYFLTAGKIIYCSDCTHDFANQSVTLPALPAHLRD